ncbi:MAG: inositol monophosphatase [Siculibacillus sp.]|nr:inositol monophosphatase [Siculibacillus sp.]
MDLPELRERAAFCRSLLIEAGEMVMRGFGRVRHFEMKGPQDYLTEYDGRCEALLRERLLAAFPSDGFFGEESGGVEAENLWVVDPIDGTANFARNIPHFCIAVAHVVKGRTEIGAIYNPALGDFHFARRGHGATLNDRPITVSSAISASASSVELGWSTRIANADYLHVLAALLDAGFNVRRAGSGALGLAHVADGRNEAYAELHMNSWDCLAGLLLVEEAGGRVCAFPETTGVRNGGAVLAAAPAIAELVASACGIALAPRRI